MDKPARNLMFSDIQEVMPRDENGRPDYRVFDIFAWREIKTEAERREVYETFKARSEAKSKPVAPHVRLEPDLISPLLRAQQKEKAQAALSFDAFDLPLFAGK